MRMLTRDEVVLCHHNADGRVPLICSDARWEAALREVLIENLAQANGKTAAQCRSLVERHGHERYWTALGAAPA